MENEIRLKQIALGRVAGNASSELFGLDVEGIVYVYSEVNHYWVPLEMVLKVPNG